jgi:hypothetical protein
MGRQQPSWWLHRAAVVAGAACAAAWLLLPRQQHAACGALHAALSSGTPAWPGAPTLRHLPVTALLDLAPPPPRASDSWEPAAGFLSAIDGRTPGADQLAAMMVDHDTPFVWKAHPSAVHLSRTWTAWLTDIVARATVDPEKGLQASEAKAMSGVLTQLARPYTLGGLPQRSAPGAGGAGDYRRPVARGWRFKYRSGAAKAPGSTRGGPMGRLACPFRNASLLELLRLREAGEEAGVFGREDGVPPYYFDGMLEGGAAAAPAAVFSALPGARGGAQMRASGRQVHCASRQQSMRGGAAGVALRLGFSPVTYGAHFDGSDNWLMSMAGTRSVVVMQPREGAALRPQTNRSHPEYRQCELGFPRDIDARAEPQAANARGLLAVLDSPGDSLHIPAGWTHYVEVMPVEQGASFWLSMARFCSADATVQDHDASCSYL